MQTINEAPTTTAEIQKLKVSLYFLDLIYFVGLNNIKEIEIIPPTRTPTLPVPPQLPEKYFEVLQPAESVNSIIKS